VILKFVGMKPRSTRPATTGGSNPMAKVIDKGWSTSSDEIAQPSSILMGQNLRKNSEPASKPQKPPAPNSGKEHQG